MNTDDMNDIALLIIERDRLENEGRRKDSEIERLRTDAERYLYLRSGEGDIYITTGDINDSGFSAGLQGTVADAAIDKALSGTAPRNHERSGEGEAGSLTGLSAEALERQAAVEMDCEDYYDATGDMPGDH